MLSIPHRAVAHLDLDSFFVSVECLKNPSWKGKPLIVGGSGDRGVVTSCSYEARRFGVRAAMPVKMARRLCPGSIMVKGDYEDYSRYSKLVTEIIADKVPVYEKASIDEFYIDLTGMDKFFGCKLFTTELAQTIIKETDLPISFGLSSNKLVSKVATGEAKPRGQLEIPFGNEKTFLAPLKVSKIPMVGQKTAELLRQMGVQTIRTLSEIPVEMLHNLLGKSGIELWRRANGIDETPIHPYHEQKSISTENTFHADTIDLDFIRSEILRMTEKIAFELRAQNKLCGCITVKLRYSNFDTVTKQAIIPYASADHLLITKARELFEKLFDRRMLVRLIGVRLTDLIPGNYQINIFEDAEETISLYQAIDGIKNRFGSSVLMRAGGLLS